MPPRLVPWALASDPMYLPLLWSGHISEPAVQVLSSTLFQCKVKLTSTTGGFNYHIWHWAEKCWCSKRHLPRRSWTCSQEHPTLLCSTSPKPTRWAPGRTWVVDRGEDDAMVPCFSTGRASFWLHTAASRRGASLGWHRNGGSSSPSLGTWPPQDPPAPAPAWWSSPHCSSQGGPQTWPQGCRRPARNFNCPNRQCMMIDWAQTRAKHTLLTYPQQVCGTAMKWSWMSWGH